MLHRWGGTQAPWFYSKLRERQVTNYKLRCYFINYDVIVPLRLDLFSYRFADQVLNSKLSLKEEIRNVIADPNLDVSSLGRRQFNKELKIRFVKRGWVSQPPVFDMADAPKARMDFMKERIGIEVAFSHSSFLGIDLLKFQVASYSALDKIDVGV